MTDTIFTVTSVQFNLGAIRTYAGVHGAVVYHHLPKTQRNDHMEVDDHVEK